MEDGHSPQCGRGGGSLARLRARKRARRHFVAAMGMSQGADEEVTCLGAQLSAGTGQAAHALGTPDRAAAGGRLQPPACTAARRQHRAKLLAVSEPTANGARVRWQAAEGERRSSQRQPGVSGGRGGERRPQRSPRRHGGQREQPRRQEGLLRAG